MRAFRYVAAATMLVCAASWVAAQEVDPVPTPKKDVLTAPKAQSAPAQPKGVSETQKGRGKLFVKENTWDFGFVMQDAKITHEFILQNVGDDTLFIERIKPT